LITDESKARNAYEYYTYMYIARFNDKVNVRIGKNISLTGRGGLHGQFCRQSAHRWQIGAYYPQEDTWNPFLLEVQSTSVP
jgi:hypothetical protein